MRRRSITWGIRPDKPIRGLSKTYRWCVCCGRKLRLCNFGYYRDHIDKTHVCLSCDRKGSYGFIGKELAEKIREAKIKNPRTDISVFFKLYSKTKKQ